MKIRSTKKALAMSMLSLMLCFAMLAGTTYAWFTDSVTSASNVIKAGTLEVGMYWAEGQNAVPTADAGWNDASTGAIFDYDKWEPGYVQVRHIKIANEGSLALKYNVSIVPNGEVSELADVIDVYYLDPAEQIADRTALDPADKIGTLTEVLAALGETANGTLEALKSDTITIAFKMQESAGNEYQDLSIGSSFSVVLVATQLASEDDSFNDQYDKDATYPILSQSVPMPEAGATASATTFNTVMGEGADAKTLSVTLPAETMQNIATNTATEDVKTVAIAHSKPVIDTAKKSVSFDSIEVVDQDGNVIDLAAIGNDKPITVVIPVGDAFAVGELVVVYHDGEAIASATVAADKTITYTAIHFCAVDVSFGDGSVDSVIELETAIVNGGAVRVDGSANFDELKNYESWGAGNTYELFVDTAPLTSLTGGDYVLDGGAKYGFLIANSGKEVSFSDMTINSNAKWTIYMPNYNGGKVTLNNIDITATSGAGLYPYLDGTTILNNVRVNHLALDEKYSDTPWGATAVAASNGHNLVINSGTYVGSTYALYVYSSGANVTINGGTFKAPVVVAADAQNGANAYVTINGGHFDGKFESVNVWGGSTALITINGGTFTNFSTTANKRITIKGGTFDADPTQWLADGYKAYDNGDGTFTVDRDYTVVNNSEELIAAINNRACAIYMNAGDYALHFTNNTAFNMDAMYVKGADGVTLSISSTEAWYGRIQADDVTFENIHFTSSSKGNGVGATRKATYKNCTFDGWTIAAAGGNATTTFEGCTIKGTLNTSTDFSSGDIYVKDCTVATAEYSGGTVIYFDNCTIGEIINWGTPTEATNCTIGKFGGDTAVTVDGVRVKGVDYNPAINMVDTLAALQAGDILYLPAGTIITTGTFPVPAGVTIVGDPNGGTVIRQESSGQDDIFGCAGDVTIMNIAFESNRKGYAIAGNTKNHDGDGDIVVINCSFKGIAAEKNYGVYKNLNGNLTIKDCTFDNYNNAICGVNNGNGSVTTITGCTFTNINSEAIGYVASTVPADFEADAIANNVGLTEENVIG